ESKTNHPYNNDPKLEVRGEGDSRSDSKSKSTGKNTGYTTTHGTTEHLVPVHEEVSELASRTFVSGDEWDRVWGRRVRELRTGEALIRLVNDPTLHHVRVERSAPGVLGLDLSELTRRFPQA